MFVLATLPQKWPLTQQELQQQANKQNTGAKKLKTMHVYDRIFQPLCNQLPHDREKSSTTAIMPLCFVITV